MADPNPLQALLAGIPRPAGKGGSGQPAPSMIPEPSTFERSPSDASGGRESKQQASEPGVELSNSSPAYSTPTSSTPPSLPATKIALCNNLVKPDFGKLIAANGTYICYAIKQNIRVFHAETKSRALLRTHSTDVVDIQMCPSRENILASTSVGEGEHPGQVVFWRLGMDDNNTPYGDAFATAICGNDPRIVGPSTVAFEARGAVWHNTDAIAAVVTDNSVLLVDLVQYGIDGAVPSLPPVNMHVKALASQPDSLATTHTSRVAGVAFSFCGEHLLSVDEGGEFCVTSFRRTPDGKLRIYRRQKLSLGTTSPVSSLALVPDPSGSVAFGTYPIMIGESNNTVLSLWDIPYESSVGKPRTLQTVSLDVEGPCKFLVVSIQSSPLILLSNSVGKQLLAIKLQPGEGAQPVANSTLRSSWRFGYVTEFQAGSPITSLSVLEAECSKEQPSLQLYCMQQSAIQMLRMDLEEAFPARLGLTLRRVPFGKEHLQPLPPSGTNSPTEEVKTEEPRATNPSSYATKADVAATNSLKSLLNSISQVAPSTTDAPVSAPSHVAVEAPPSTETEEKDEGSADIHSNIGEIIRREIVSAFRGSGLAELTGKHSSLTQLVTQSLADIRKTLPKGAPTLDAEKLAKSIGDNLTSHLSRSVSQELLQHLPHILSRQLKLEENLKMTLSANVPTLVSKAVAAATQSLPQQLKIDLTADIREAFKAQFMDVIVPGFERGISEMIAQVRQVLTREVDTFRQEHEKLQSASHAVIAQVQAATEALREAQAALSKTMLTHQTSAGQGGSSSPSSFPGSSEAGGGGSSAYEWLLNKIPRPGGGQPAPAPASREPKYLAPSRAQARAQPQGRPQSPQTPIGSSQPPRYIPTTPGSVDEELTSEKRFEILHSLMKYDYEAAINVVLEEMNPKLLLWVLKAIDKSKADVSEVVSSLSPLAIICLLQQLTTHLGSSESEIAVAWVMELLRSPKLHDPEVSKHYFDVLSQVDDALHSGPATSSGRTEFLKMWVSELRNRR